MNSLSLHLVGVCVCVSVSEGSGFAEPLRRLKHIRRVRLAFKITKERNLLKKKKSMYFLSVLSFLTKWIRELDWQLQSQLSKGKFILRIPTTSGSGCGWGRV